MSEIILNTFMKYNLCLGRLVSYSKSGYRKAYPDNEVYFNANIITEKNGKIWYGDIDITKSANDLNKIAKEIGQKIYVLREMDCRFDNEDKDPKELIKLAVWSSNE